MSLTNSLFCSIDNPYDADVKLLAILVLSISDKKLVSLPSLISVEVVSLGDESSPANNPASDDKNKLKNKAKL